MYPLRTLMYFKPSAELYIDGLRSLGIYISRNNLLDSVKIGDNIDVNFERIKRDWKDEKKKFEISSYSYQWSEENEVKEDSFESITFYGGIYLREHENAKDNYLHFQFVMLEKPSRVRNLLCCLTNEPSREFIARRMLPVIRETFATVDICDNLEVFFKYKLLSASIYHKAWNVNFRITDYSYKWNDSAFLVKKHLARGEFVVYCDIEASDEMLGKSVKKHTLSIQLLIQEIPRNVWW